MKKKQSKWVIEIKDLKTRQHFAPATKKINSKKVYSRKAFKNLD